MTSYIKYFSVLVTDVARRTLLEVLVEVGAKKLVNPHGAYLYQVSGEEKCLWIEPRIRGIVGIDNYRRYNELPREFSTFDISDVTLV